MRFTVAGKVLQEFTGQYLHNMVQRDFSAAKKDLFNNMTGNTKRFNDPANYGGCNGNYPSFVAINNNSSGGESHLLEVVNYMYHLIYGLYCQVN